ncbi:hypothetical protein CGRA01v4_13935 [Colletotrichum graminicola]|uniref:Integral membrane protein n=1 Tax=Colletotrichum graminicola (strain M1.001 / M2 / FGSC 10212) TaxID=645133 RepID=E3QUM6_COLGM|nr:uncharacterized protein GLRG_09708 [Colletotrichum graminicola M1.001]EFQ34564.1 hypothetical protein GLRG_09708 [Colletotrichum graminicola M1.001]WDK22645.1 hypothetical protein CGRA01v4_13935 [Colletotrichum graminicola]
MSLLYFVPVVSSTVTLWLAVDQYLFFGIFLNKKVEPSTKDVLTPYWNRMIETVVPAIIAPLLVTVASTTAILSTTSEELLREKGSFPWYIASTALAASHFAFVPIILPKIRGIQNGALTPGLRRWMRIHIVRSVTVDLLAWITCIVASAKTLSV